MAVVTAPAIGVADTVQYAPHWLRAIEVGGGLWGAKGTFEAIQAYGSPTCAVVRWNHPHGARLVLTANLVPHPRRVYDD